MYVQSARHVGFRFTCNDVGVGDMVVGVVAGVMVVGVVGGVMMVGVMGGVMMVGVVYPGIGFNGG